MFFSEMDILPARFFGVVVLLDERSFLPRLVLLYLMVSLETSVDCLDFSVPWLKVGRLDFLNIFLYGSGLLIGSGLLLYLIGD
jgi:hypothetical protein